MKHRYQNYIKNLSQRTICKCFLIRAIKVSIISKEHKINSVQGNNLKTWTTVVTKRRRHWPLNMNERCAGCQQLFLLSYLKEISFRNEIYFFHLLYRSG